MSLIRDVGKILYKNIFRKIKNQANLDKTKSFDISLYIFFECKSQKVISA